MQEDLYIQLIYKKLSGELSSSESSQLDSWLAADVENQHTLESISKAWEVSADLKPKVKVDLDDAFAALDERIALEEKEEKVATPIRKLEPAPKSSSRYGWRIAAGFLLLVSAVFLFRNFSNNSAPKMVEVRTEGQSRLVNLPDGSVVTLNKNSSLNYPESFEGKQRQVEMTGEAFFDIEHNPEQPFVVSFNKNQVEVLGTSFNINLAANQTTVGVLTGKVRWKIPFNNSENILTAGMVAVKNNDSGVVLIEQQASTNIDYWRDGKIEYEEKPLGFVLLDLERIFNVQISEIDNSLKPCRFTSSFSQASLDDIFDTLSTVFGLKVVKVNETTYQLKGGECQ